MKDQDLKTVQVGTRVAFSDRGFYDEETKASTYEYKLGTVKYITPSRARFDIEMDEYNNLISCNKDGRVLKGPGVRGDFFVLATPEIVESVKLRHLKRRMEKLSVDRFGRVRNNLTVSQVERIIAILEEK